MKRGQSILTLITIILINISLITATTYIGPSKDLASYQIDPETYFPISNAQDLKDATNLKKKWSEITEENIQNNYLEQHLDDAMNTKNLDSEQLTYKESFRKTIREIWNNKKDSITNEKTARETIEKISDKDFNVKLKLIDDHKKIEFDKNGNKDVLKYGDNKEIPLEKWKDKGNSPEIELKDGKIKHINNQGEMILESNNPQGTLSLEPTTPTTAGLQGPTGFQGDLSPTRVDSIFAKDGTQTGTAPPGQTPSQTQQPSPPPYQPGRYSQGGSGSYSQGGSQGSLSEWQQAINIISQIIGMVSQAIGSNGQGKTQATANQNGGGTFNQDEGSKLSFEDEEQRFITEQNNPQEEAVTTVSADLENVETDNTKITDYAGGVNIETPTGTNTDITMQGVSTSSTTQEADALELWDDYQNTFSSINGVTENIGSLTNQAPTTETLNIETNTITGMAITNTNSEQSVKIIQHEVTIKGKNILVQIFKAFDNFEAQGSGLLIKDKDINIKFNGPRTYYPRQIKESYNGIGTIKNTNDKRNQFKLINYKASKARFIDSEKWVSVGDWPIKHPRNEKMRIPRIRKDMWVER